MNEHEEGASPESLSADERTQSTEEPDATTDLSLTPTKPDALSSPGRQVTRSSGYVSTTRTTLDIDSAESGDDARAVAVVLALIVGALGAALPAIVFLWLIFALLATGVAAETLEQTGGLVPTTFGGGYWTAVAVNSVTVLICSVRWFVGVEKPWRPLVWLTLMYGALIWLLVPLDWKQRWDAPDIVTTFAVLGADMLVTYLLPVVLLGLMLSGLKHAWLASQQSVRAAGRVIALGGSLGLLGASLTGALYLGGTEGYYDQLLPNDEDWESLETFGVEDERQGYAELAAGIGPPAPARYTAAYGSARSGFHACAEELATADANRRAPFRAEIERLVAQGMARGDAEDTVMDTLLRVCLKNAEEGIDELRPYFHRAVCRNSKKQYRRSRFCSLDSEFSADLCACEDDSARVRLSRRQELQALRQAVQALRPDDREVLELRYDHELDYAEVAEHLGITESAARQRVKRARDRLRKAFEGGQ